MSPGGGNRLPPIPEDQRNPRLRGANGRTLPREQVMPALGLDRATLALLEDEIALDRLVCDRFRVYVEQTWPTYDPLTQFQGNWHIDILCEVLEAFARFEIKRLLLLVPPNTSKSSLFSVLLPSWLWGPATFPGARWLGGSYDPNLAMRDSVNTRRVLESPWFQARWGDQWTMAPDQNSKMHFENLERGLRYACGIGGGTGQHAHFCCADDPHSIFKVESDLERQEVHRWWDELIPTRGMEPERTAFAIIMQRTHYDDLAGHVLKEHGTGPSGYDVVQLPMEYEKTRSLLPTTIQIQTQDPRTDDGDLLWPERISQDALDTMKAGMTRYAIAGQLQLRPVPREGGIIQRDWIRYWTVLPGEKVNGSCLSWDFRFKNKETSSFVVGQAWLRFGARFYLIDEIRAQLGFLASLQAFRTLAAAHPSIKAKLVELKANGDAIVESLQLEISGIIGVEPRGDKDARLEAVSPFFAAGNVYVPSPVLPGYQWVRDWVEEIASAPNALYRDRADACSQALDYLGIQQLARNRIQIFGGTPRHEAPAVSTPPPLAPAAPKRSPIIIG